MIPTDVSFAELRSLLLSLGFVEVRSSEPGVGYRHADSDTLLLFREYRSHDSRGQVSKGVLTRPPDSNVGSACRNSAARERCERSGLQAEKPWVAEVAVAEAIEKPEAGDAVKSCEQRWNAHHAQILGKSERGKLHGNIIERKRSNVGATQRHGRTRNSAAKHAIFFVEDEVENALGGTGAGVGKQRSHQ